MEKFFNRLSSTALTVICATLLLVGGVYAATTISSNISTGGTLDVTGNATTSANLVVGASSWAAPTSTLTVSGSAHFTGVATSSTAFWVGSAGSANNINMLAGDLYVQDDAEIDGGLYVDSATTTDTLRVGGYLSVGGVVALANSETIGNATNNNVFINSTGISLATSTATTSAGIWVGGQAGNSTSTIILGGTAAGDGGSSRPRGCIELYAENLIFRVYVSDTAGTPILKVEAGRCKD